jgi:type IV pilus assembly protein PilC
MEMVLKELARNMEKDVAIRSKIRGALFYPAFILTVMLVVGLIMTTKVIPQLKDVFLSSGQELPGSTKFLLNLSDFLINYWYFLILGVIGLILLLRVYLKSNSGTRLYSKLSLKLPVMGDIIEQSSMARFGRLLGMLLNSGVPLLEALKLINDSFTNTQHKDAMTAVSAEVERGIPMSVPINARPKVFPAMVAQMVAVGEQTGKMDEVMTKMAEYYESEVEAKVAGLASLIEPVIIVILGLGVAWLVQAILLPIYSISTNV